MLGNHTQAMAPLRILVTGCSGFVGPHVIAAITDAGHLPLATGRRGGDAVTDLLATSMVAAVVQALQPDLVINLAALAKLQDCERDPALAERTNVWLPQQFAERFGARLLHVSTDLVFDGAGAPYAPGAAVAPRSIYGASKARGEEAVGKHGARVVRLPLLFGPDAQGRGASASLRTAAARRSAVSLFTNEYRTPLHVVDAARALVELIVDPSGPPLVHLPGPERVSRWQLGGRFAAAHGLDAALLHPTECQDPLRPRDVSLASAWRATRSLSAMLADC